MERIPLVNGRGFALVDDADVPLVSRHRWYLLAASHTNYAWTKVSGRTVYMHGLIMGQPGIDHIDHDGLNNQRSNLRPATGSQNNANSGPRAGAASPYKGVFRRDARTGWRAQIRIARRNVHLGSFTTEEDAARAYDAAALAEYGEFARLNFPR
jgi:hypothetical protein